MTRKFQSRAWAPGRTLSVLDLKGRVTAMAQEAARRGCTDHHELLVEFHTDLVAAISPDLEREDALVHLDKLAEDAEVLVTAFEAMEADAPSVMCSMESEGIVEATGRAIAAFQGGRRNRSASRWKWRVAVGCKAHQAEVERRLASVAPVPVKAAK